MVHIDTGCFNVLRFFYNEASWWLVLKAHNYGLKYIEKQAVFYCNASVPNNGFSVSYQLIVQHYYGN